MLLLQIYLTDGVLLLYISCLDIIVLDDEFDDEDDEDDY